MTAIFYREKKNGGQPDKPTTNRANRQTLGVAEEAKHAGAPLPPVVVKKGKERKEIRTK